MALPLPQPVQEVTVMTPASSEPSLVPPETVSPVVVALPKLVLPKTLIAPNWAPPVTPKEVEVAVVKVAAPAEREPKLVPPETVSPVVVAFWKRELPETVKAPPKYTLPEEWTERRFPGLVVPMPTLPAVERNKVEVAVKVVPSEA